MFIDQNLGRPMSNSESGFGWRALGIFIAYYGPLL